ncbi:MAG: hypothetical protein JNJ40_18545 [Bacteroidia bacterium]|nr:hypothetical protein [Bacteroidia bacterium]
MRNLIIITFSLVTMVTIAQKEIILPQDSTKRTWDFFKYFTAPSAGNLNDVVEPSACLKTAQKKYDQSNTSFEKLWNDFHSGSKSYKKIKNAEKQTATTCKSNIYDANAYKSSVLNATDKCLMAEYYFKIKGFEAFIEKCQQLYPSNSIIGQASEDIKTIVSELGDQGDLKAIEQKNKEDKLAKVEPPKALSSNPEWEKWFKDYFIKEYAGYKFIKQYLRSTEWSIHRNEVTSIIIDRQIASTVAATKPDGTCVLVELALYQNYEGGKYGASYFLKAAEAQQQILCEKVK